MKILVGTNTLTEVNSLVHGNHLQFWFRLAKQFPDFKFITFTPNRTSIDMMRNESAKAALENECDYLMFIDDDVLVDPHKTFASLFEACEVHGMDVVMAETYIRGYPFEPMFFKHENEALIPFRDFKKHINKKTGLVRCHAVGFSCVIIRCELLKKVTTPYFITGPKQTEDVYFCMKAMMELGEDNVKIAVDTKVPTGHLLDREPIHSINRKALIEYYEKAYPELKAAKNAYYDRGTEYAKAVNTALKSKQTEIKSRLRQKQN